MVNIILTVSTVVVLLVVGMRTDADTFQQDDPEGKKLYQQWMRGSSMSEREFLAIRAKNAREQKLYGDGTDAPYWPTYEPNGHYTLHRGVWVSDRVRTPPNRELDRIRGAYARGHRAISFTLVEGEQMAPYGKEGALVRVRVSQASSELRDVNGVVRQLIPMVTVCGTDHPSEIKTIGSWCISFSGTLPAQMTRSIRRDQ